MYGYENIYMGIDRVYKCFLLNMDVLDTFGRASSVPFKVVLGEASMLGVVI